MEITFYDRRHFFLVDKKNVQLADEMHSKQSNKLNSH